MDATTQPGVVGGMGPGSETVAAPAGAADADGGVGRWVGRPLWVLGHQITLLDTPGAYAMLEAVTAPGVPGPPPHHHDGVAEFFYVVDGVLEVLTDGTWQRLEAGRSLSIAPGVVHTFRNPGATPARWLTGFSPRDFERLFTDFGIPADRPDARDASVAPAVLERLVRDAAGYGMIIAHA